MLISLFAVKNTSNIFQIVALLVLLFVGCWVRSAFCNCFCCVWGIMHVPHLWRYYWVSGVLGGWFHWLESPLLFVAPLQGLLWLLQWCYLALSLMLWCVRGKNWLLWRLICFVCLSSKFCKFDSALLRSQHKNLHLPLLPKMFLFLVCCASGIWF